MQIDLHCNLPYNSNVPNPATGYLKGFLVQHNVKTRNLYWNLMPPEIYERYASLSQDLKNGSVPEVESWLAACFFRYFFSKDMNDATSSIQSIYSDLHFSPSRLENMALEMKKFIDETIERKGLYDVKVAGFTMKASQWLLNYYILKKIKDYNPGVRTIIGGVSGINEGMEFMRVFREADFAVWGEGEVPLLQLMRNIDDSSSYSEIPQLIYREKKEMIPTRPMTPDDLPDINRYPFADHSDYFNALQEYKLQVTPYIPIWGIRSCAWNRCKFCVLNKGYIYRERTPENIVEEIEYQAQKHGIGNFIFVDNDIGRKDRGEFKRLLELLVESVRRRKKPYSIRQSEIMPQRLDKKTIEDMRKIRFDSIQIGFEATSDSLLEKIRKKHRFIHNIQALKLADELGLLLTGSNIIMGVPSETEDDISEGMENLQHLRFLLRRNPLTPVRFRLDKGAPYYDEMPAEQREKRWNGNPAWPVIKGVDFMSAVDRWDFYGFYLDEPMHSDAWRKYLNLMSRLQSENLSYNWVGYPDGSSDIEETETVAYQNPPRFEVSVKCRHTLDRTDTEILTFCDTIKNIDELRDHFPELAENKLKVIALGIKRKGLLYVSSDFCWFLSLFSSERKIPYAYADICIRTPFHTRTSPEGR